MTRLVLVAGLLPWSFLFVDMPHPGMYDNPRRDKACPVVKINPAPKALRAGFVSSNVRFSPEMGPSIRLSGHDTLRAWKGEKTHTQILLCSDEDFESISISAGHLKSKYGHRISKSNIVAGFIGYVMTDEYREGCGNRNPGDFDSSWVADPINTMDSTVPLYKNKVQPVWISVRVPADTPAGDYQGIITVKAGQACRLNLTIKVLDRALPPASQWSFNLDLWQHPAAIARVHNVRIWSDAHFALMKKYYTMLADAGQKNITASIVDEPWGHQTYDDFPGLIKWTKKKDGNWHYDYSLFDKYVSFVMDCGIKQRINCYSMVPWNIAFKYYDESAGKDIVFTGSIGTAAYNEFWSTMLKDFTMHLKARNWFSITAIAMDERPMQAMESVIKLLKEIDRDWKIALAGEFHPEIESDIYEYCIASRLHFPDSVLLRRSQQGLLSTWYTCCSEPYPNGFTFSPPAEHVWIGWYTAAKNLNGYLRWAYNSWPQNPLYDSRFTAWPAGDTYQVYPGPMTSIRFEKLIEGIQDFEKIQILKHQYIEKNDENKLSELEQVLSTFTIENLSKYSAEKMLENVGDILNKE